MLVLLSIFPVSRRLRSALEMDRESVASHRRIEILVLEIDFESKLVAVVGNRPVEIVDQELRNYGGDAGRVLSSCGRHAILRVENEILNPTRSAAVGVLGHDFTTHRLPAAL